MLATVVALAWACVDAESAVGESLEWAVRKEWLSVEVVAVLWWLFRASTSRLSSSSEKDEGPYQEPEEECQAY